jgi:xanthosine utilization system XapX-like protein
MPDSRSSTPPQDTARRATQPLVAQIGLFGMFIGEQIIPLASHMLEGSQLAAAWRQSNCTPPIFGLLPGGHEQATQLTIDSKPDENT